MFKLSSIPEDYLLSSNFNNINIHKGQSGIPLQYFEMNIPLMIHTISVHNMEQNHFYTSLCLAPDFYTYYSFPETEAISLGNNGTPHQHNFYELIYILRGELCITIEDENCIFTSGCGCLINKNVEHCETSYADNTLIFYLQLSSDYSEKLFSPHNSFLFSSERSASYNPAIEFIMSSIQSKNNFNKDYLDLSRKENTDHILKICYQLCENIASILLFGNYGGTYTLGGEILRLFSLIGNSAYYHINQIDLIHNKDSVIFSRITYLLESSNGRISRSELEKKLHYNGIYLNNIVHKFTGMTIFEYGTSICMQKAKELLLNTDKSVSEIATQLKFTNKTHFYKLFQEKYHMTPQKYRNYNKTMQ